MGIRKFIKDRKLWKSNLDQFIFIERKPLTPEEMRSERAEIACPHCGERGLRLVWIPRGIHFACEKCMHVFDMTARGVHATFH